MLLESLEVQDFRNLRGSLAPVSGLNILVGDNGQGKTNWLEAIYLLSTTRSFKTAKPMEAICFGEDLAIVRGRVRQSEEITRELQVALQASLKILSVNGKKETLHDYLGQLHAIVFNSDAVEIVRAEALVESARNGDVLLDAHDRSRRIQIGAVAASSHAFASPSSCGPIASRTRA